MHIILNILLVVLCLCLIGILVTDCALLETFENDSDFEPDNTYFTISHENPSSTSNSSSQLLRKRINNAKQKKSNPNDSKETKRKLQYWFWNGNRYSKKNIQQVLKIILGWKHTCSDTCSLWIRIGDNPPIQVDASKRNVLKDVLNKGLENAESGLDACCTPKNSPPNDDFQCIRCPKKSAQNFKPQLSALSGDSENNTVDAYAALEGSSVNNGVSNFQQWNAEKLSGSSVQELLQEVFSIKEQCSSNCKLWLSLSKRRPVQVTTENEGNIRAMISHARSQGDDATSITFCCAPKHVKLTTMYNAEDDTFNCQRCDTNIGDAGSAMDEGTTVSSTEAQTSYAAANISPRMVQPSGSRWTSADNNVTPYNMTINEGATLMNTDPTLIVNNTAMLQNNTNANQELIYTNTRPVMRSPHHGNKRNQKRYRNHHNKYVQNKALSHGFGRSGEYSDNNNVIFHKHLHTFTNSANMCS